MTKCAYTHELTGVPCDGEASFILYRHNIEKPVCDAIAHHIWAIGKQRCFECRRPKWKCWDVLPIQRAEVTA